MFYASFNATDLNPNTSYSFTVQNMTVENAEKSPMSDPVQALTLEAHPSEPLNFRLILNFDYTFSMIPKWTLNFYEFYFKILFFI